MKRFVVFIILCFSSLNATIFVPIDSTSVVKVELSSRFQNRIAVSQSRISQIVHPGCDIDINLDNEIGQVFVYPLTSCPQATSLTVITEEGDVQDFELSFAEKPGEIIVLESFEAVESERCIEEVCIGPGHPEYIAMVVQGILSGCIPEGYVSCDTSPECRKLKRGLQASLVSKFVSLEETVYIWRVENVSRRKQKVTEMEVNFQGGKWVYLNSNCLNKKGQTIAIVGVKN